jgi:hypothetical protein
VAESRRCVREDPWRWWKASQGRVPGPPTLLEYVKRERRSNPQGRTRTRWEAVACGERTPGGGASREQRCSGRAALMRERLEMLESSNARTNPQEREAGRRRNRKKCWRQHDVKLLFSEAGHRRHKHRRRESTNGGTPVGYSGRIALRREQCGIFAQIQDCGTNGYGRC